jgi:alpha-1,3-rhamnosyl/mannosyltransferase
MPALAPADEFVCLVDPLAAERFDRVADNVQLRVVDQTAAPTQAASADGARSVTDMLRFTRAVASERLDVFFSPSVYTFFPLPPGLAAVVTLHDAIAERFPHLTLPTRKARLFWRSKVRLAIWQSRLILTVSEFSARELNSVLGIPKNRIRVTSEAPAETYMPSSPAESAAAARRLGLPEGATWFIYVGGFNPHKRLDVLIRAHAALVKQNPEAAPYLILVGSIDRDGFYKNVDAIKAEITAGGTSDFVRWAGYVPDDELRHLHSGALALALVSECEGFGLPAVEAAACQTAVIATRQSPLPELLRDGGIFIDAGDERALLDAMRRMQEDAGARQAMAAAARLRASELTWESSAQAVLATLREAANGRPQVPTGATVVRKSQLAGAPV